MGRRFDPDGAYQIEMHLLTGVHFLFRALLLDDAEQVNYEDQGAA